MCRMWSPECVNSKDQEGGFQAQTLFWYFLNMSEASRMFDVLPIWSRLVCCFQQLVACSSARASLSTWLALLACWNVEVIEPTSWGSGMWGWLQLLIIQGATKAGWDIGITPMTTGNILLLVPGLCMTDNRYLRLSKNLCWSMMRVLPWGLQELTVSLVDQELWLRAKRAKEGTCGLKKMRDLWSFNASYDGLAYHLQSLGK